MLFPLPELMHSFIGAEPTLESPLNCSLTFVLGVFQRLSEPAWIVAYHNALYSSAMVLIALFKDFPSDVNPTNIVHSLRARLYCFLNMPRIKYATSVVLTLDRQKKHRPCFCFSVEMLHDFMQP